MCFLLGNFGLPMGFGWFGGFRFVRFGDFFALGSDMCLWGRKGFRGLGSAPEQKTDATIAGWPLHPKKGEEKKKKQGSQRTGTGAPKKEKPEPGVQSLAAAEDGGSYTMTGTMEYAAPEVLDGESPSEQQDEAVPGFAFLVFLEVFLGVLIEFYRVSSVFFPGFAFRVIFWGGLTVWYLLGIFFFDLLKQIQEFVLGSVSWEGVDSFG